jgi:type III restriction enzyme
MNQAQYKNCDFQVHTPRDENFKGREYVTEEDRATYSKDFIKACRTKKLDAVAITDHHDLCFYKYINDAAYNEKADDGSYIPDHSKIVVFPGMELTIDLPCQALLIIDSTIELTQELIIKICTALGIQNIKPDSQSKSAQTTRLPINTINEIYDRLEAIDSLKGRFIIFPNIKENGGDSILREGFHNQYAAGKFVGGYLDYGQYEKHKSKTGWNNVIEGKTNAYGNRSIGLFQTSDCRIDDFSTLGDFTTYVKWSDPTAEGLRQACLAKTSRISQELPILPSTRITRVKIIGASFLKDIDILFSPQFNVCIGGRGTGKSSLLQYVSWVLGGDTLNHKKEQLTPFVENTLNDGFVKIGVIKNGILHRIKRSLSEYIIKIGNNEWESTDSKTVSSIIRTDSFAQKELSQHEKNKSKQLVRILENQIKGELNSIDRKVESNASEILEISASYIGHVTNLKSKANLKSQIDSIEEQIKSLNTKLSGIPKEDQEILQNNSLVENEKQLLRDRSSSLKSLLEQISEILSNQNFEKAEISDEKFLHTDEIKSFAEADHNVLLNIEKDLRAAIERPMSAEYNDASEKLGIINLEHDKKYAEAKERQASFQLIINQIENLREHLKTLKNDLAKLIGLIAENKHLRKKLQNLYFLRLELMVAKYDAVKEAAINTVKMSEDSIDIEITQMENLDHIRNKFTEEATGSKGQPQRISNYFDSLKSGNQTYLNLLRFWRSLELSTEGEHVDQLLEKYGIPNNSLIENDFMRILSSFSTNDLINFSLHLPTYNLNLRYKKEDGSHIPFEDASYGQQAGAILTILLNQQFGPLIIDQPEDDLDNKVIHSITENIISAKHSRQIIFSSHNANIAVNGDAELIMVFDHDPTLSAGVIKHEGSIDKVDIKTDVKEIMEGGIKAFDLRKAKYDF